MEMMIRVDEAHIASTFCPQKLNTLIKQGIIFNYFIIGFFKKHFYCIILVFDY
jgi:hypothetical protein